MTGVVGVRNVAGVVCRGQVPSPRTDVQGLLPAGWPTRPAGGPAALLADAVERAYQLGYLISNADEQPHRALRLAPAQLTALGGHVGDFLPASRGACLIRATGAAIRHVRGSAPCRHWSPARCLAPPLTGQGTWWYFGQTSRDAPGVMPRSHGAREEVDLSLAGTPADPHLDA